MYILCGSFLGNAVGVAEGIGTGTGTGTGNDSGSGAADDIVAPGARVFAADKAGGTGNGTGTGTGMDMTGTEDAEGESAETAEEYKTPLD